MTYTEGFSEKALDEHVSGSYLILYDRIDIKIAIIGF
jgi:hypothetical protein